MAEDEFRLEIRLIEASDRLSGLSLGDETFTPLKTFLQKHAKAFQANSPARTYGAFDANKAKIIGYITLVCGEIVTGDGNQKLVDDPRIVMIITQRSKSPGSPLTETCEKTESEKRWSISRSGSPKIR